MWFFDDFNRSDLLWLGDWGLGSAAVLTLVGLLVIGLSVYDLRQMTRERAAVLVGLRTLVYGLAVVMLLEPALDLTRVSKVPNHVPILVDRSTSMSTEVGSPGGSRAARAQEIVGRLRAFQEEVGGDHKFEWYSFDGSLHRSDAATAASLDSSGKTTDILTALDDVQKEFRHKPLGGVILLSDGIDTASLASRVHRDEELDRATAQLAQAFGVPVHTVALATSTSFRDVAVRRVVHDDFAFVHNKVGIDVEILVSGMENLTIPVVLRRGDSVLQTKDVRVRAGQSNYRVRFEFVPTEVGKHMYGIEVPGYPEELIEENNSQLMLLEVIRDKVRVLQVVGRPSWDERFLRRMLKENPSVDLISFFILRTEEDVQIASTGELSLIPFPTEELFEEELGSFDLIFFQNFNFGPYSMRRYLPLIANFVREGGGFVMLGGDLSFSEGGYAATAIEEILPVRLPHAGPLVDTTPFRPQITAAGLTHPITQLAFDRQDNIKLWQRLPLQSGTNNILGAKPSATVLATHPRRRGSDGPMPVLSVWEAGKGRAMALTTDSSWRWGFHRPEGGTTPQIYHRFWQSAIRWLIQDPDLNFLRLEVANDTIAPSSVLHATVHVAKPDYSPAEKVQGRITVTKRSLEGDGAASSESAPISSEAFSTGPKGTFDFEQTISEPGWYEIHATAERDGVRLEDKDLFLVAADRTELRDLVPREDLLRRFAEATGGAYQQYEDFSTARLAFQPPRVARVDRREVVPLWDSILVFALIMILLGVEWTCRRRWGRL
jgi:uncharacterized membrane protein